MLDSLRSFFCRLDNWSRNYEYKIEYDNDILTNKNLPANISNSPPIYKQEPQRHSEFNLIVGEYKLPLEGTLITMEKSEI